MYYAQSRLVVSSRAARIAPPIAAVYTHLHDDVGLRFALVSGRDRHAAVDARAEQPLAVVAMPARSEPVPGSVIAIAVTISPLAHPGSHFAFCSGLPNEYR